MRVTRLRLCLLGVAQVLACASQACAGHATHYGASAALPTTTVGVQAAQREQPREAAPETSGGQDVSAIVANDEGPVDFDFRDDPELQADSASAAAAPAPASAQLASAAPAAPATLAERDELSDDEPDDGALAADARNGDEAPPTDAVGETDEPDFVDRVQARDPRVPTPAARNLHASVQPSRAEETARIDTARISQQAADRAADDNDEDDLSADVDVASLGDGSLAPEPEFAAGPLPMFGAIMLHKVKSYDAWRAAFDETMPERRRAGFAAQGIMRGVDDPNLIAVWLAVTDVDQARAYFGNKGVRARMGKAGILGRTQLRLSSNVSARMEPGRTGLTVALIAVRVEDFPRFAALVEAHGNAGDETGIIGYALGQDVVDAHRAYVYLQGDGVAPLRRYLAALRTRQQWREAGVRGSPTVTLVQEGELAPCR